MVSPVSRLQIDSISSKLDSRSAHGHRRINAVLTRMESATLQWTRLMKSRWPDSILLFSLPLKPILKAELVQLFIDAAQEGAEDVAREHRQSFSRARVHGSAKTRAEIQADIAVHKLEGELKKSWSNLNRRANQNRIDYETRLVFATHAGWEKPKR